MLNRHQGGTLIDYTCLGEDSLTLVIILRPWPRLLTLLPSLRSNQELLYNIRGVSGSVAVQMVNICTGYLNTKCT